VPSVNGYALKEVVNKKMSNFENAIAFDVQKDA
jgi:hypothetical protein